MYALEKLKRQIVDLITAFKLNITLSKFWLSLVFSFIFYTSTFAVVYTTTGNGNWNAPGVWTPNAPPCTIPAGSSVIINHTITMSCNTFINGTLTINFSAGLNGAFNLKINSSGVAINNGKINSTRDIIISTGGRFTNSGTITCFDFTNQGVVNNNVGGIINTIDDIDNQNGTFNNNGTLNLGDDLKNDPGTFVNNGNINVGDDINNSGGNFTNNGSISVTDNLDNQGGTWIENGNTTITNNIDNTGGGTINGIGLFCVTTIDNQGGSLLGSFDACNCANSTNPVIGSGIIAPAVTFCASILPIELLSFKAVLTNNNFSSDVNCFWATASEINNDFFTIERSNDGVHFEVLAMIKGAGNSISLLNYSFIDSSPLSGTSYYRLTQTDFNGTQSSSQIVSVENNEYSESNFDLCPNPNKGDNFTILMRNKNTDIVNVNIINSLGDNIYSSYHASNSNGKISVNLDSIISSGIYYVRLITPKQKIYTKKMIVN